MPIHFVSVQLNGAIFWIIASEDPPLFDLSDSTEWSFLNPILYDQLELFLPRYMGSFHQFAEGKYFGHTTGIAFATRSDDAMQSAQAKGFSNLALISVGLLARLRHASGQATIPGGDEALMAWGITKRDELPVPQPVDHLKGAKTRVQEYWWKTAITAKHIRTSLAQGLDFVLPSHEVLFLDAAAAYRANDHRKAILYAAIAVEVAFGSVIDREYERVRSNHHDERFRIIARPQAGETPPVYKDPIYERLRRRPDFKVLIHELAFYVLRRSLLAENESLYLKAIRLYFTRNKLAHSGTLTEDEIRQTLTLDNNGSLMALRTALELFSWLGERADFPLPDVQFIVPGAAAKA